MPGISSSWRWAAAYVCCTLAVISREICRSKVSGTTCFSAFFEAATIHYAVAKRFFCAAAFWAWLVRLRLLDSYGAGLSAPQSAARSHEEKLGILRYVMFLLSLALVSGLFLMQVAHLEQIMFWLFLPGMRFITLSVLCFSLFQDNRAFCKYLCPITVFLKPMSYFSLLRVHCDEDKCVH